MKKSIVLIVAMSCLAAFLFLSLGCNAKPAAPAKSVNVIPPSDQKVAKVEKTIKAKKTEKIVKVLDVNGSNVTYALGEGKKERVNASSFPGSLKAGDVVTVTKENGMVTIAKYRGMKMPIGC